MSDGVFDPEYEYESVSQKENGIPQKRDDRKQDLEDFCVNTIVFENKDSILDAVMSVSKVDSASVSLENSHRTVIENADDSMEVSLMNGHFESPSTEQIKENVCVSEFTITTTEDESLANKLFANEDEAPREYVEFKVLPDVVVGKVDGQEIEEATINDTNGHEEVITETYILDENVGEINVGETEFTLEDTNLNDFFEPVQGDSITSKEVTGKNIQETNGDVVCEVIDQMENKDFPKEVMDELPNGHGIYSDENTEVSDAKEGTKKNDCKEEIPVSFEQTELVEDKDGGLNEKDIDDEHLLKEENSNNVLSFIRKKTRSLGRTSKNARLSSKSDEQIVEGSEKSKKKPLFKIFIKDKQCKEEVKDSETQKEDEFEDATEEKMSKSFTKFPVAEGKQEKKPFKFFKNVFQKSDRKLKHECGDKIDVEEAGTVKELNAEELPGEKADVATDNVVATIHPAADAHPTTPNKLFTIAELEAEKATVQSPEVVTVDGSVSFDSQEGYHCSGELGQQGEEIFQEMVNKKLNSEYEEGVVNEEGRVVDDHLNSESVEQAGEVVGEVNEGLNGEVVVEGDTKVDGEATNNADDLMRKDAEIKVEENVVEGSEDKEGEVLVKLDVSTQEPPQDKTEVVEENIIPHEEQKIIPREEQKIIPREEQNIIPREEQKIEKDVQTIIEKTNGLIKDDEEEPKKIKKKNFVLTLPSFNFAGFSKAAPRTVQEATKKEDRRSLDDLDNVTKTKKVKKRTKSFHFGRRGKKEVVEEAKEEVHVEQKVNFVENTLDSDVKKTDDVDLKKTFEEEITKSENKSKLSTLKWPKFSKKAEKKDEMTENKEDDGTNKQNGSKQSRQGTLTRGFLKLFSRKGSDARRSDLNGMVYSLEDNMVIAADKSVTFEGCYESGQALQEADGGKYFVVVAIDFGTTFSGYAFSFVADHTDDHPIHIMRKWEGGDPGVNNQKTPTIILLTPNQDFHTFGFTARDFYHNLDATEAAKWLYFDKFKMALHNMDIHENLTIPAANGVHVSALKLFAFALKYFKEHALKELSGQSNTQINVEDIRWVITVPAIWKAPAKQFMRKAAHMAEITTVEGSNKLLIALEPEAASIYIRRLKRSQLVPEKPNPAFYPSDIRPSSPQQTGTPSPAHVGGSAGELIDDQLKSGTRYIVVDCGGGTVDLTVHEMEKEGGLLKELYKATGGPYGSTGVDQQFEQLLRDIFGSAFIDSFKVKRPAGWVDLMIAFESRKRTCSPFKDHQHNISMPFSFIDFHKKYSHNTPIDEVVRRHNDSHIKWSPQGMLRLSPEAMTQLFTTTIASIIGLISNVVVKSQVQDIEYLFLVGGFAESSLLQSEVRKHFEEKVKVIIPQDVSLTILRGAVCYGLDPTVVSLRRSHLTYGIGVVHKFVQGEHDHKKMVRRDGVDWCADVFDGFVKNNQPVALNDSVIRRYAAIGNQDCVTICVYSSEEKEVKYVTDAGVSKCATLTLKLDEPEKKPVEVEGGGESGCGVADGVANGSGATGSGATGSGVSGIKQIDAVMTFGDTEIKVTALEVDTGKSVKATIDFLNL